jgi:pyruvate carboxylase subunit B
MKKKYLLNMEGQELLAVVASGDKQTQVQLGEGPFQDLDNWSVLNGKAFSLRVKNRMHLVHLTGLDSKGNIMATIDGRPVPLQILDELRAQALASLSDTVGSGTIAADIPGLVVEVKVKVGQVVRQGEPVIVVEAMKMQNELCAAVGGTVSAVPVEEGQPVNPGDPLVVIEPEPGG